MWYAIKWYLDDFDYGACIKVLLGKYEWKTQMRRVYHQFYLVYTCCAQENRCTHVYEP